MRPRKAGKFTDYRHDGETVGHVVAKREPVPEDLAGGQPGERDSGQHEPGPQIAPDAKVDRVQDEVAPLGPAELEAAIALPTGGEFASRCEIVRPSGNAAARPFR